MLLMSHHVQSWKMLNFHSEGVFGAHMVVSIENDGPVTLTIESAASCTD